MPTLLISGANRGIGLELTKQYLTNNWEVIATCRAPEEATQLQQLKVNNSQLRIEPLDITDHDQISQLSHSLKDTPIDLLLNNAGYYANNASVFGQTEQQAWQDAVHINVLGPMKMMEYFVQQVGHSSMKTIVSITSKMGSISDNNSGGHYAYRATKAALNAIMVSAAQDLRPRGIKVLILHPGWVRTDMGGLNGQLSVEQSASMLRHNITQSTMKHSGIFQDIDGSTIPW